MEFIGELMQKTEDLTILQMILRGIIVFVLAIFMLQMAGKKTFGKRSPADNVIMIMLGAILSRGIVGSSPFVPVILTSFAIILFHRLLAWLGTRHPSFSKIIRGEKISLFKNGKENHENMQATLISKEDLMEGIRLQVNSDSFDDINEIFIERNGQISVIKKTT
jgi:uncharacterized membrane protein YcaP (DUF421 family)